MDATHYKEIKLIGLALKGKTSNKDGQSNIDCGNLWQKFESEHYASKIPNKVGDEIYAVYHHYEGDHTQPFSYFIGCKVESDTKVPEKLDSVHISAGSYLRFTAKGKMPQCIAETWQKIWGQDIDRDFITDFEVYDERSKDWNDAALDIFISVNKN